MKNMRAGERCDGHFVRSFGQGFWGIENPPKFAADDVSLISIGQSDHALPTDRHVHALPDTKRAPYPSCPEHADATSDAPWGYTSGAIAIGYFQERADVQRIDVLGMNFTQSADSKHDTREKPMMNACCSKCVVHPTPRNTYLP